MRVLSQFDIASLLKMPDVMEALEGGFRQLADGNVVMPQRAVTEVTAHDGLHLSMPAFVGGDQGEPGVLSVKIVAVYPNNAERFGLPMIQGVILLHDAANGRPLALMDAERITAMRTGAVSGVATRCLARSDATRLLLFGAGALGADQMRAVSVARPIQEATVITRSGRRDAEFCRVMSSELDIPVRASRDPESAVQWADIICTATTSLTPLFDGNRLQPGTHINAVGAYHTAMRELDTITVQRSRVYVDQHEAAQSEAGDIMIPVRAGRIDYDHVCGELGGLLTGKVEGRTSDRQITLFKSVGLAMQDAVTVIGAYQGAVESGIGTEVEL